MVEAYWAYGVVPGAWAPPRPLHGIAGRPVEIVGHDGIAVLASAVPRDAVSSEALEDFETLTSVARAHDGVLHDVLAETDVAPFRICTLYGSRAAIEDMLRAEAERLEGVLAPLRGRTEWGVKAFLADAPAAPKPASGAEYLARRRADRDRAGDSTDAAVAVHEALSAHAAAATLAATQDRRLTGRAQEMVLNGAYLVERAAAEGFVRHAYEQQRDNAALELELTGPWPPYHFV